MTSGVGVQLPTGKQLSYQFGYTSAANGGAGTLNHGKLVSQLPTRPQSTQDKRHGTREGLGPTSGRDEYSDDCYNHDSDDTDLENEPDVSCRHCAAEAGQPMARTSGGSWVHPSSTHPWTQNAVPQSRIEKSRRDAQSQNVSSDLTDRFGRVTLDATVSVSVDRRPRVEVSPYSYTLLAKHLQKN